MTPVGATAQTADEAQVLAMLSTYENLPGPEQWRRLGTGAIPILRKLYEDRDRPTHIRLRSVRAVSYYPAPAVRSFLLEVAGAPGQNDLFIREALLGLGRSFRERAAGDIAPFLNHRKTVVREAACHALREAGNPAAREAMRKRLRVEPDSLVRAALERALRI
jgi:HEAT repeat protein